MPNTAYHLYVAEVLERDRFQATMDERGVATLIDYRYPSTATRLTASLPATSR